MMPVAKARWMSRSFLTPWESLRGDGFMQQVLAKFSRLQRFMMHLVEGRNPIVPLEQGRGCARQLRCVSVHFPDRIEHGMIVSIKNVFLEFRVACDMDLPDAMVRNVVE